MEKNFHTRSQAHTGSCLGRHCLGGSASRVDEFNVAKAGGACNSPGSQAERQSLGTRCWRLAKSVNMIAIIALVIIANSLIANPLLMSSVIAQQPDFIASPLTKPGEFTPGIEGPACDRKGDVFVVNFARQQTIGRVSPDGQGTVWVTLPGESTGNGIVFDPIGTMYIADYVGHNVLRAKPGSNQIEVFAHNEAMNQPNDLAIAPDGTLYASDPNWKESTGQLWKISQSGQTQRIADSMGTTNGIEVSPDGKWLYVNESVQRNVWKFPIKPDGSLGEKILIKQFSEHSFDGMRCDVKGNLYITRHGKGTVIVMTPAGEILREINVLGSRPSNLCFGGADGKTVYVTEVDQTRLVQFRSDSPGLAWTRWKQ
ncbi:MAG: SMP-30/gluconolactonase/LRE family protein [Pirellula sp.]